MADVESLLARPLDQIIVFELCQDDEKRGNCSLMDIPETFQTVDLESVVYTSIGIGAAKLLELKKEES